LSLLLLLLTKEVYYHFDQRIKTQLIDNVVMALLSNS